MTTRNMTAKGFFKKSESKAAASVEAFLAAHKEWLLNGEASYCTAPVVARLDAGELLPTPALQAIREAVMGHLMLIDMLGATDRKEEAEEKKSAAPKTPKPFIAYILDEYKNVMLKKGFDLPQRASEWVDRRLVENGSECSGEVAHKGKPWEAITREESLARILGTRKSSQVCKSMGSSDGNWRMACKPSKAIFSHG
jgi:hypothetical protein